MCLEDYSDKYKRTNVPLSVYTVATMYTMYFMGAYKQVSTVVTAGYNLVHTHLFCQMV